MSADGPVSCRMSARAVASRSCGSDDADGAVVDGVCGSHGATDPARSGTGAGGRGGDAPRRWGVHQRYVAMAGQAGLFGPVASDSTCWRVLDSIGEGDLPGPPRARAAAREVAWAQRGRVDRSGVAGVARRSLTATRESRSSPAASAAAAHATRGRTAPRATDDVSRGGSRWVVATN
jgi:hypothetical protein